MDVASAIGEGKEELHGPRAVVGIHKGNLHAANLGGRVQRQAMHPAGLYAQLMHHKASGDLAAIYRSALPAVREPAVMICGGWLNLSMWPS